MNVLVERFAFGRTSTLGSIEVPGLRPGWTLEDERRTKKIPEQTCIPVGTYQVKLRTVGGFHGKYLKRFGAMHRGMLWLQNVPGFQYILIHCGNDETHTAGCILVGDSPIMTMSVEFTIGASETAYRRLYPAMAEAAGRNELTVEVRERGPE